jgi:hypothetical protein
MASNAGADANFLRAWSPVPLCPPRMRMDYALVATPLDCSPPVLLCYLGLLAKQSSMRRPLPHLISRRSCVSGPLCSVLCARARAPESGPCIFLVYEIVRARGGAGRGGVGGG